MTSLAVFPQLVFHTGKRRCQVHERIETKRLC